MRGLALAGMGLLLISLALMAPLSAQAADVAAGQQVYSAKCKGCHGDTGAGDGPLVKAMKLELGSLYGAEGKLAKSDEELIRLTLEGKDKMPAYQGKLTDEEMANIMAFLHSMEK